MSATTDLLPGHSFDQSGYDIWGYNREGHYSSTFDRRPFQASPFPHCTDCDDLTCKDGA